MTEAESKRLQDIHDTVVEIRAEQKIQCERLDEHHETLYGNGGPGVKMAVDRLEQVEKRRFWILGGMFTAILATAGKVIADHFAPSHK